jgi:hypothetical protein
MRRRENNCMGDLAVMQGCYGSSRMLALSYLPLRGTSQVECWRFVFALKEQQRVKNSDEKILGSPTVAPFYWKRMKIPRLRLSQCLRNRRGSKRGL